MLNFNVYTDGGVIGKNPSILGGTWAFCFVDLEGNKIVNKTGKLLCKVSKQPISNNYMELYAILKAFEMIPDTWEGSLYTDSNVSLCRIRNGKFLYDIPEFAMKLVQNIRDREFADRIYLLAGHPNKNDLAKGYKTKTSGNVLPVSKWNVWCDKMCNKAKLFKSKDKE